MITDSEKTPIIIEAKTEIRGFVMPTWVAVLFGAAALCSYVLLLVGLLVLQFVMHEMTDSNHEIAHELRVLELHTQDVELLLKERHLATERDFAQWDGPGKEKR